MFIICLCISSYSWPAVGTLMSTDNCEQVIVAAEVLNIPWCMPLRHAATLSHTTDILTIVDHIHNPALHQHYGSTSLSCQFG